MSALSTRELSKETWADFEALFGKHGGVQAGCWCMFYHRDGPNHAPTEARRRALNRVDHRAMVAQGLAHGILVYDGSAPVGWCQYGERAALPRIEHGRKYRALGLREGDLPAWRITCFFVEPSHRRRGVTYVALDAALSAIGRRGGGVVEAYPSTNPRGVAVWFGNAEVFRRRGFRTVAPFGRSNVIMRRTIPAADGPRDDARRSER